MCSFVVSECTFLLCGLWGVMLHFTIHIVKKVVYVQNMVHTMLWQDFRKWKVGYLTLLQDWSPSSGLSILCDPVENSSYADIME